MNHCYFVIFFLFCLSSLWSQESLTLSLKQAEDLAIQNNYQLNASLHRLEQGYYGYQASKDYFLPNISFAGSANVTNDQHNLNAVLKVVQPLYDKMASFNLKEAQIQWEMLRLEVQQQICDILFQVREAYDEILLHQAHLALDQMVIQIWQEELKRQERHLELGASIPYEVNQTRLHLKNAWIELYATQQKIQASQIKLLTALSLPPDTSVVLTEKEILLPCQCQKTSIDQWKQWSLEFRPELKQEQFAYLLSRNKIQQAKAENSPIISIYANGGHRYINNGFDRQPSLGVGVNIDWSLYNPSNKQRIKQAKEGNQSAASTYYQLEVETIAETYQLLSEMKQYYQSYLIVQEGATIAEEGMELANKKHQLGLMSAFEYRDAIKVLHEAKQNAIQARFNLRHTYHRLIQHTGVDLSLQEEISF